MMGFCLIRKRVQKEGHLRKKPWKIRRKKEAVQICQMMMNHREQSPTERPFSLRQCHNHRIT